MALAEEFFKGQKDVGDSSGAGTVPHRSLYTHCSFGWLGDYDCVVFDSFILGLTEAKTQERRTGFYDTLI